MADIGSAQSSHHVEGAGGFFMAKKLFVGGLSWNTTEEALRKAFETFGTVTEAKTIVDRETGRSRGFGFVTFAESEAADAAVLKMNGGQLDGRTIRVNEANEPEPRGGGDRRGGRREFGGGGERRRW
jgi:RNA recognition motif-containing protein